MPTRQVDEFIYTRKTAYYRQPTHEFNLPAGWSCPHADICLTKADKDTGKLVTKPDTQSVGTIPLIPKNTPESEPYVCYVARAERYPNVRDSRWHNYTAARARVHNSDTFEVPKKATHVRVHGSGDFFNEAYFCLWLETAEQHPGVNFWAFTKSIGYWTDHIDEVPGNFALTASVGSKQDQLIDEYGLRTATVYYRLEDVPEDMAIDFDDWEAQNPTAPSFALLENMTNKKQADNQHIHDHNRRAYKLQGRTYTA